MTMRYRADHVGSLLRPPELIEARTAFNEARLDAGSLQAVENAAILGVLEQQRQAGIGVFTDGEYRRHNFYSGMIEAVDGLVTTGERAMIWRGGEAEHSPTRIIGGRLKQKQRLTQRELPFLQQHAPGPIKVTLPTAVQLMRCYKPGVSDRFYASREELAQDLAAIVHREIEWLIEQGVPYIQIDAPGYTGLVDPEGRERVRATGVDPDAALDEAIAIDNASVAGLAREGVTIALHMCRGNSRSRWLSEGSYEPIAEKLFNQLKIDRLLLEYDSERAGGFEPLRFVPPDKEVVLGLVTTKNGELEQERYVPADRLALSLQCGFASAMLGNLPSMDDQRRKLELVARVARRAWG